MSIYQGATTSFKVQLAQGLHNFGPTNPNTFYIALYTANAALSNATTVYTSVGEVSGSGYTPGGKILTITQTPTSGTSGTTAYWSFANAIWNPAAFTARGALIYNSSQSNAAVCVLDFGSDITCANSFRVQFPTSTNTTAILRIA